MTSNGKNGSEPKPASFWDLWTGLVSTITGDPLHETEAAIAASWGPELVERAKAQHDDAGKLCGLLLIRWLGKLGLGVDQIVEVTDRLDHITFIGEVPSIFRDWQEEDLAKRFKFD